MAAAQRIGPYEVLEPSSEEIEKVRKGTRLIKSEVPRKTDEAEAWQRRGRGPPDGCAQYSLPVVRAPGAEFKIVERRR